MSRDVVRVSWRAVPTRVVALHLVACLALLALAWRALDDDGPALMVLRGVAVLLATALALAVDEPGAPMLDATPTTLAERLAARTALCAGAVVPVWLLALALPTARGADVPYAAVTLEALALAALGLAVPMALRRWWRVFEPALVTGPLLFGAMLAAGHLPRGLTLLPGSPLDPAWDGAHARWALLLLAAGALVAAGAADPATATTRGPLRRR